jgi:glycosyltransferase involved in cell wall biosynthesis
MIVKNENHVIKNSLASVKDLIDYWVIVDTGSTDGTQEMIRDFMKDIPGELHERPWVNFEVNRGQALELAKDKCDYIWFMDADEELLRLDGFVLPELNKDSYQFTIRQVGYNLDYGRILIINAKKDWRWKGVVHETLLSNTAATWELVKNCVILSHTSGSRSSDPQKYLKDARLLEKALEDEPDNTRYIYYLAQSYLNVPDFPKALEWYEKRSKMKGWDEEIYHSLLQVAVLQESLQMPPEVFTKSYLEAYGNRPSRVEPLYYLIQYYIKTKNYYMGYALSKYALPIPRSKDATFVSYWMYDWGILLQYAECSFNLGKYDEAKEALDLLSAKPDIPQEFMEMIEKNRASFYR